MTDYELASLLAELQGTMMATLGLLFTIISAFLVAGYVAAHRLNILMTLVVLGVYTFSGLLVSFELNREAAALVGVVGQIQEHASAGKGLGWHPAAGWTINQVISVWMTPIQMVVGFVMYGATIGFFFSCRRHNQGKTIEP